MPQGVPHFKRNRSALTKYLYKRRRSGVGFVRIMAGTTSSVEYRVRILRAQHELEVEMKLAGPVADGRIRLQTPTWVPGDYATIEADGTLNLLGRGSVCINTGGEKVYPEEVEAALKAHPDVFDAVVIGVPDDRLVERVAAIVTPRRDARPSLPDLQAFCRTRLAGYKVPRQLELTEDIPRTPVGKPDYRWAKRLAERAAPAREPAPTP